MRVHHLAILSLLTACNGSAPAEEDTEDAVAFADPFDSGGYTDCELVAVVQFANNPATTFEVLRDSGVHSRAARNVTEHRDGVDQIAGTVDDQLFGSIYELDEVPYVGPKAIEQLVAAGANICENGYEPPPPPACAETELLDFVNEDGTDADVLANVGVYSRAVTHIVEAKAAGESFSSLQALDDVPYVGPSTLATLQHHGETRCLASGTIMSPQLWEDSHLNSVARLVDLSRTSIDIAIYSFRDGEIFDALERARERGVSVRVLFQSASEDRKSPAGTRSARLEDMGIEVRWINKIMHHKFGIFDGPRSNPAVEAKVGTLVSGSANWSSSAATRFDENTMLLNGEERLNLLFQREFNHLWEHSRPVEWNEEIEFLTSTEITQDMIDQTTGADAVFTSSNFRVYESSAHGWTFSLEEGAVARGTLVEMINGADDSIWIASGHMRSRQVAEALIAKAASDPSLDIRIYLDGQEYVSAWYHGTENDDYDDCVADAAGDAGDLEDCDDDGLHFGHHLSAAGLPTRYKFYAYRWDYSYADQMHHKYLIVDKDELATGSYNMSTNAEYSTMENLAVFRGAQYQDLIDSYVSNHQAIWETRRDGTYDTLIDDIENGSGDSFPIVFDPMALDFDEIDALKDVIYANCSEINSDAFRRNASSHRWCDR